MPTEMKLIPAIVSLRVASSTLVLSQIEANVSSISSSRSAAVSVLPAAALTATRAAGWPQATRLTKRAASKYRRGHRPIAVLVRSSDRAAVADEARRSVELSAHLYDTGSCGRAR